MYLQATFDSETVSLLSSWLSRLPEPVCLVAHNGRKFDFPHLIRSALYAGETLDLDDDLYYVDSLEMIRFFG